MTSERAWRLSSNGDRVFRPSVNGDLPGAEDEFPVHDAAGLQRFIGQVNEDLDAARAERDSYRDRFLGQNEAADAEWQKVQRLKAENTTLIERAALVTEAVNQGLVDHYSACALKYQGKRCSCAYETWWPRYDALAATSPAVEKEA